VAGPVIRAADLPAVALAGSEVKTFKRSALESELGATGTVFFRGLLDNNEFNPNMRGLKAAETYEEMRRSDGQVRSILKVLKLPILSADWIIECEDPKIEAFLKEALFERIDWEGFLGHALLCLDFGYEILEKVFELDQGKVWLKKLAHRGQQTVYEWKVDEFGDLTAVVQQVYKGGRYVTPEIPASKISLFVLDQEGNDFEGISILRSAYKHWFIKDNVYKVDAIAHERFGIGVPTMQLPEGWNPTDKTAAETICEEYRAGEKAGVVLPPGYVFSVSGAGEVSRYDPMPTIKHHDEMIARGPLAMFLNLGTTETGARSLGDTFMKLFLDSEWGLANLIRKEVKRSMIRPLLELNFPNARNVKADLSCAGIGALTVQQAAQAASVLGLSGFLTPDDEIEGYFRKGLEMPLKQIKEGKERKPVVSATACGHRHVRLLQDAPTSPGPEGFWRALTEPEKAMALREIDGHQDDAKQHITDAVSRVRGRWIDSLKAQIAKALSDGDPSDVEDVAIPPELMKPLLNATVDLFRDLYRYGRRTIQEEARRQKKQARLTDPSTVLRAGAIELRDEPPEDDEVNKMFWVRGRLFLGRLSSKVESRARDLALTLYRTKKVDFTDEDLNALADQVLGVADTSAKLEANVLVSEAVNLGRDAEIEIQKEDIEAIFYSAILDERVCEICQGLDGEEYEVGSQEYYDDAPPNRNCLGGDRCRCLYVAIFK